MFIVLLKHHRLQYRTVLRNQTDLQLHHKGNYFSTSTVWIRISKIMMPILKYSFTYWLAGSLSDIKRNFFGVLSLVGTQRVVCGKEISWSPVFTFIVRDTTHMLEPTHVECSNGRGAPPDFLHTTNRIQFKTRKIIPDFLIPTPKLSQHHHLRESLKTSDSKMWVNESVTLTVMSESNESIKRRSSFVSSL